MRRLLAAGSSDRISSFAVLTAGLLCGVSVFFVALPLAQSSPFPTPKDGGWISEAPAPYRIASAGSVAVTPGEGAPSAASNLREELAVQAAIEWEALTVPADAADAELNQAVAAPSRSSEIETVAL